MASWAALNASTRGADDLDVLQNTTEEAKDADDAGQYEQALRLQQQDRPEEAKDIYRELLKSETPLKARLRYLCHKNLATLEFDARAYDTALTHFVEALAVDDTDVVVWHQAGRSALQTGRIGFSRYLLEQGVNVDDTYWPLVQLLCEVLHGVGDMEECHRVAGYIKGQDPHNTFVQYLENENKASLQDTPDLVSDVSGQRQMIGLKRVRSRVTQMQNIADVAGKRRRTLQEQLDQALQESRKPTEYILHEASWTAVGKLLLEAYAEASSKQTANAAATKIFISLDLKELSSDSSHNKDVPMETEAVDASETKAVSKEIQAIDTTPKESDAKPANELKVTPPTSSNTPVSTLESLGRRKSRRHEERMREEHEEAIKLAREKDLNYRLQSLLLPSYDQDAIDEASRASVAFIPPLTTSIEASHLVVYDEKSKRLADSAIFIGSSSAEAPVSTNVSDDLTCTLSKASTSKTEPLAAHPKISRSQIETFVRDHNGHVDKGIDLLSLMRSYLDQSGEWGEMQLAEEENGIADVLFWIERLSDGRVAAVEKGSRTGGHSLMDVMIENSSDHPSELGKGLSIRTKLFLLELRLDALVQQHASSPRRRYFRQIRSLVSQAHSLLLSMCWDDDFNESSNDSRNLVRLLWLLGQMNERQGDTSTARAFYIKCLDALNEISSNDTIHLPNLKTTVKFNSIVLQEKISGLQYSDVCEEANRLFTKQQHDKALDLLLNHFFPMKQPPRVLDMIYNFSTTDTCPPSNLDRMNNPTGGKQILEMIIAGFENSQMYGPQDLERFLFTILHHSLTVLEQSSPEGAASIRPYPADTFRDALSAIEFILTTFSTNQHLDKMSSTTRMVLLACCVRCLNPPVLLLFEHPKTLFSIVRNMFSSLEDASEHVQVLCLLTQTAARAFMTIEMYSTDELRNLFASFDPHPKKKPSSRRERVRAILVDLIRYVGNQLVANSDQSAFFSRDETLSLLLCCSKVLKEADESIWEKNDQTAEQLFGNSAIAYLRLRCVSSSSMTVDELRSQMDAAILLHARLGEFGICDSDFLSTDKEESALTRGCFLEEAIRPLTTCLNAFEGLEDTDGLVTAAKESLTTELVQCYHCLYDVSILQGCDDHSAEGSLDSLLQHPHDLKVAKAKRMAQFAFPLMLVKRPKGNSHKKELLKLLFAVRDACQTDQVIHQATLCWPSDSIHKYICPDALLSWDDELPQQMTSSTSTTSSALKDLWFLVGENFIVNRVRRRSNLTELVEMEKHAKERIGHLFKDVLYYEPSRIESWMQLGRTLKDLYHAVTDAWAVVLGQHKKSRALLEYIASVIQTSGMSAPVQGKWTYEEVVAKGELFKQMKLWEKSEAEEREAFKVQIYPTDATEPQEMLLPEYIVHYVASVVELSYRCFCMAGALAGTQLEHARDESNRLLLRNSVVEGREECGLLLYNILQEFSSIRHVMTSVDVFPCQVQDSVIDAACTQFEQCIEMTDLSFEETFRFHYMLGKTLMKRFRRDRRKVLPTQTITSSLLQLGSKIMAYFATAEKAHVDGELEHGQVHAFYSLQAMRLDFAVDQPLDCEALRLACTYYYGDNSVAVGESSKRPSKQELMELVARADDSSSDDKSKLLRVVRGWLFLNIVHALETIAEEDRYFHPSRYVLATCVHRLDAMLNEFQNLSERDELETALLTALTEKQTQQATESKDTRAPVRALKELYTLFDKKRPQVVAIWLLEHVPVGKKFDELNQRQTKYDYYRIKYWKLYVTLLAEAQDSDRLKDAYTWAAACKEDHDVIDALVAIVLRARKDVLRRELHDFLSMSLHTTSSGSDNANAEGKEESRLDTLKKKLAKMYAFYVDMTDCKTRVLPIMDDFERIWEDAELMMVMVFLLSAAEYPQEFKLMPSEEGPVDVPATVQAIRAAVLHDLPISPLPPRDDPAGTVLRSSSKAYCEAKWPDRMNKSRQGKSRQRSKQTSNSKVESAKE